MYIDNAKIRQLRDAQGLSQQAAGEAAGFDKAAARIRWWDIESGKTKDPQISTVLAVCRALGCRVQDLVVQDWPRRRQKRSVPSSDAGSNG